MEYKAIVFDLGGVVIDLDRAKCIDAFHALGCADIQNDLDQYTQKGDFFLLETGGITAAEFYDRLRNRCPKATSDVQIQDAFNEFLVALPLHRLECLRRLRKSYQIFALSNTNPVMFNSWIRQAFMAEGLHVDDYFDGMVLSFQEGCCKPNTEIFNILISRYSLDPATTLYLDDSQSNCNAADSVGLCSRLVTPQHPMSDIVANL